MFCLRETLSHHCNKIADLDGFHLLEMLMVVVVISILATIGMPLYTQHLAQAKRVEAKSILLQVASAMEEYAVHNHTYAGATLAALHHSEMTAQQHYRLQIQTANDEGFLLAALPQGKQATDDQACATLTLDDKGTKGITGTGLVNKCWQ